MALSPDKEKPVTLSDLAALGCVEVSIKGTDFHPPPNNRGIQRGMKPRQWEARIVSADGTFPAVSAKRPTPGEAFKDAAARFAELMKKRPARKAASEDDLI